MFRNRKKTIAEIFRGIEVIIPEALKGVMVNGVHYDSRKIEPGDVFVAIRGYKTDGHKFLKTAGENGAAAAVVESENKSINLPQIITTDSRKTMALLAANFFASEISSLRLVGITGTNGKTTTSFLVRSVLEQAGIPAGLIGTIAYHIGKEEKAAWNTTPESVDLCAMLSEMAGQNQQACVLEVSSHALTLDRVAGLQFAAAVFTNLSRDHLDFHRDEEDYFLAKSKLFSLLRPGGIAVINQDDVFGKRLISMCDFPVLSFGFNSKADIHPTDWKMDMSGMRLNLMTPEGALIINTKLISEFNIQNILAAVGVGIAFQIPLASIQAGIEAVEFVPGRLQAVAIRPGIKAFVDYSHTPDALEKAIKTLRQIVGNRLIVVFGCGGDRDKGKRPVMGRISESYADFSVVTTDNPRTEDPQTIISDILAGMSQSQKYKVIVDRREAISEAVKMSVPGDIILIAGKGHESYQEINGVKYDFDEIAIVREAAEHV